MSSTSKPGQPPRTSFAALDDAPQGALVLFVDQDGLSAQASATLGYAATERIAAALAAESFRGKAGQALVLSAETVFGGTPRSVVIIGVAEGDDKAPRDVLKLGGQVFARLPKGRDAGILTLLPGGALSPAEAAELALGLKLAAYRFDQYQTRKKPEEGENRTINVVLHVENPALARKEMKSREAVHDGVVLARDLVNEPANVLTPSEFARRAAALEKLGVEVETLDEKALRKLGMRALLGVGQGSAEESRVVILRWQGSKDEKEAPLAFIGKGVVFDSGGISIKPAGGMEDMKGDMAGAAAVVGLMHTLASRKAKVNVLGAIGLVENMPDGKAQRPGDIVTSMSGQTIEIINTDAEGRLVLADVLWHVKQAFSPKFMVNLATLTGAIVVALGNQHAGLFSNDDALAENLLKAGQESGERLWRMPLGAAYDKDIDSKFADVKNSGGRNAGAITAAQFLQRFVDGCPWAHLDIAGTAMGSPQTDISRSWASGFGVRLLDRLVARHEG